MRELSGSAMLRSVMASAAAVLLALGAVSPAQAAASEDDAVPDRVILTPTQDPATSQSFTWRTGADVTTGFVQIREAGSGAEWRTVDAVDNAALDGGGGVQVRTHSATVDGLHPETAYEYTVGDEAERSAVWEFTTAGAAGDPFTFLYFGDAQTDLDATWGPTVQAAFDRYPDAVGSVHGGDLIDRSDSAEWTQWFDGMADYATTTNVIAAPGNHEYTGDPLLTHWKSSFEFPANGPTADPDPAASTPAARQAAAYRTHMAEVLAETAYYTDYQGVRFISLNASRSQARPLFTPPDLPECLIGCPDPAAIWLGLQAEWLDAVLADNPNQWAVAVFHQPVFSTAIGRDEVDLRESWLPILQGRDIDLVLMGHDHGYARGHVDTDDTDTPGVTTGPVYVVAVAGSMYFPQQPADDNVWVQQGATLDARASGTSTFQAITVDGGTLHYEAVVSGKWDGDAAASTDVPVGDVLDSFTITKYANGEKFVTEAGVEVPAPSSGDPDEGDDPAPPPAETPAGTPADVPLEHLRIGTLTSPTVRGPVAFDQANGVLYVGDAASDGVGRVEAIDVVADEVLRSFDIGTPITAMSFMRSEGGRLLVASLPTADMPPAIKGRANGFAVNPAFLGAPMREDDIVTQYEIRGLTIDPGSSLVYFALPTAGHVAVINMLTADYHTQSMSGDPYGVKVDEATGHLYVATSTGSATRLTVHEPDTLATSIRQFTLPSAMPLSVDLDTAAGLAYVSHGGAASGVTAVEVLADTSTTLTADLVGDDVLGLATSPADRRVYVSTGEGISVVSRAFAPEITASPIPVTVPLGETTTLRAGAAAVPAPTIQWQLRDGEDWTDVEGATTAELVVSPTATAQYRAVFSNEVESETYSTASASATVTVGPPSAAPDPVDSATLVDGTRGGITVDRAGRTLTVTVGSGHDGEWVAPFLHSTPQFLGWQQVSGGSFTVTVPVGTTGSHRLAVLSASGTLLGWGSVQFAGGGALAVSGVPHAHAGIGLAGAVLLVLLGSALLAARMVARRGA